MNLQIISSMCELESRTGDGIEVRLLWNRSDGRAHVSVFDTRSGDSFTIEVREQDRALDVFDHPYAHAARRGIDTSSPDALLAA